MAKTFLCILLHCPHDTDFIVQYFVFVHLLFSVYFQTFTAPTTKTLFFFSHNMFYHACSYAKVDYTSFVNTTAAIALERYPKSSSASPSSFTPCSQHDQADDTYEPQ